MPQRSVFVFDVSFTLLLYHGSRSLPSEKSPQLQIKRASCVAIRRKWKTLECEVIPVETGRVHV